MIFITKMHVFDKNQINRFKSKKSDLNQINLIFLIFLKKSWFFCNPALTMGADMHVLYGTWVTQNIL